MPQLLLELFSEEIPARMQARAEADLARLLGEKLVGAGLPAAALKAFSTPRRLTVVADGLPARSQDVREERKGPRVGAPDKAIDGFLRSAGLNDINEARVVEDAKGGFYVADITRKGVETVAVISAAVPEIVRAFPWPKSMRSGVSDLYWVRPLQSILCTFDGETVPVAIDGVPAGAATEGHRFMAPGRFEARRFDDYRDGLKKRFVVLDREERKAIIARDARTLCEARNLDLVEDAGLLEEVAGLAEWPVVVMGDMDPAFLDLPGEVIRLTMRTHQRYFAVRDPKTGKLAPHFITVANVAASDGGKEIARGNAKVLGARLNDARFFWDIDCRKGLEDPERLAKLDQIVFHQKLGSVGDKVRRIEALAVELAPSIGADVDLVRRAAKLCKADLVTETVGEFPELQGQIGRQLAELAGETASVAVAIDDHYRPLGPNDRVPTDPVAICIALADKLDSLVGFWRIDETPTGSSDPYGLRRATLGLNRILQENKLRLPLAELIRKAGASARFVSLMQSVLTAPDGPFPYVERTVSQGARKRIRLLPDDLLKVGQPLDHTDLSLRQKIAANTVHQTSNSEPIFLYRADTSPKYFVAPIAHELKQPSVTSDYIIVIPDSVSPALVKFDVDRLKVQLREQGKRHDLVDAVFAPNPLTQEVDDDLVRIVARVEALEAFLKTEDGKNLLAGYKRAANILAAEDKKGALKDVDLSAPLDAKLLHEPAEKALAAALAKAAPAAKAAVETEDFAAAMSALAALRAPVDAFMTEVLVNADDKALRENRLKLLNAIRGSLAAVADFSKIEG